MTIFGLTGGIGSGKSTVAKLFVDRGMIIIDADKIGHDVLRLPEVELEICQIWGDKVVDANGEIDRRALAAIVFSDSPRGNRQLEKLSSLTHPRIGEIMKSQILKSREIPDQCILIDAPLLLEGGWDHYCSEILFVDAPVEVRITRVLERGWTVNEFRNREKMQFPLEFKRSRATRLINNNGSLESLEKQVDEILEERTG